MVLRKLSSVASVIALVRKGAVSPAVIGGPETIEYDDAIYDVGEGDTLSSAIRGLIESSPAPVDSRSPLEIARSNRLSQLHSWWDSHPGVEVLPGVFLPTQEVPRGVNELALMRWRSGDMAEPVRVVDANDVTIEISPADVSVAYEKFMREAEILSNHWDATIKRIRAASSESELNFNVYDMVSE